MTTATSILRKEHDAILRMLDVAEEVARRLDGSERVAPETLSELLEFFRVFADRCHHGKEEDLLFPLLEKKGLPHPCGPTTVMRAEHELGRALIERMVDATGDYSRGATGADAGWTEAARSYVGLLRAHIDKENNVLFKMAEYLLTDAEQQKLASAFERVEEEKIAAGTHERLHLLMERLTADILAR